METITSRQNALVKTFRALAPGRDRAGGRLLLEGAHLVEEAMEAGLPVEVAALAGRLLERRPRDRHAAAVRALADRLSRAGSRVVAASEPVMAAMSPAETPSGILAIARHEPRTMEATLEHATANRRGLVLLLADVQDPGNLGAMIRTAEAAGATGVVACGTSADPFGWKALRGAMGSSFRVPVASERSTGDAVRAARGRRLRVLSTGPRGGRSLFEVDLTAPCAIVLGSEGSGVPSDVAALADEHVAIPMRAPVESLNVAVSAALILYEAYRQREARIQYPESRRQIDG
jgi:TrmH family RNA methyltransferase